MIPEIKLREGHPEIWIDYMETWEVSNYGRCRVKSTGELKHAHINKGYLRYSFQKDRRFKYYAHRIVVKLFKPTEFADAMMRAGTDRPEMIDTHHDNEVNTDNFIGNLVPLTKKEHAEVNRSRGSVYQVPKKTISLKEAYSRIDALESRIAELESLISSMS